MTFDELKDKALSLPLEPGVYIMRDKFDHVIYVGKAKKLKNRVSQYFQDTANHTAKTRIMVSKIDHFDVIVAASEFEALVLECSLIKRHQPKYNILLKDDKGYPYIRLNIKESYPRLSIVSKLCDDGAGYYGPFGSRGTTNSLIETINRALKLPNCSRSFPRDIGKDRPCLHYHMNQCAGWCQPGKTQQEYNTVIEQVRQLLLGNYKAVASELRQQMLKAAEDLDFELAATIRNQLNALENLNKKQLVTAATFADTDVIGFAQTEVHACMAILHYSNGNLLDKEYELLQVVDDPQEAVSSLLKQYYTTHGFAPKNILLPFALEDSSLFELLMEQQYGRRPRIRVPQRGDNLQRVLLANKNALEESVRITDKDEKISATLRNLGKLIKLEPPKRIESFDISNISGTDIVASMVVFENGKPHKSGYKRFKLENMAGQDDYGAMHQIILRRFQNYLDDEKGFEQKPDVVLIDGGITHANTAQDALNILGLSFPVFGMVKDDRHRTRALVTPEGETIGIDGNQSVFALIGSIQEETHRFAITYHRKLRSKRLHYSELDSIAGVGPKRKELLLKKFKSIAAIANASVAELARYLPQDVSMAVYQHFHPKGE